MKNYIVGLFHCCIRFFPYKFQTSIKLAFFYTRCFYLRRSNLGWFLFSRFFSIRSDSNCFKTSVAYSSFPWSPVMMSEATLPRSRMEKLRCISKVRMNVSRKTLLLISWAKSFRAFSTFCCPFPWTYKKKMLLRINLKSWCPLDIAWFWIYKDLKWDYRVFCATWLLCLKVQHVAQ